MGGQALKDYGTERKSALEYFAIAKEVVDTCQSFCVRCEAIPAYTTKPDFGDGDFLMIPNETDPKEIKAAINAAFKPQVIIKNDSCYSFDFHKLQIDLIVSTPKYFEPTRNYFSFNDLGNIIGRTGHKMGFKYGHLGLSLPFRRHDSHIGEDLEVSLDTNKILKFLGYDPNIFFAGFSTLEEIFAYAVTSPYFNKEAFSYESMNHTNRTRQRKRLVYNKFLEYLETRTDLGAYEFQPKEFYKQAAVDYFPEANLEAEFKRVEEKLKSHEITANRFNGNIVAKITKLQGAELGQFIIKFKNNYGSKEAFEKWIEVSTDQEVVEAISKLHTT